MGFVSEVTRQDIRAHYISLVCAWREVPATSIDHLLHADATALDGNVIVALTTQW